MHDTTARPAGHAPGAALLASVLLFGGGPAMAIEEPAFTLVEEIGDIEIRRYAPYLVAETLVEGKSFDDAGNEGFRRLFRYITGANGGERKIAMTAPVNQSPGGDKIAMTAPVDQAASADGWAVSFVVPSRYDADSVPQPTDPRVYIREIPGDFVAVRRYSGLWSEARFAREREALLDEIEAAGYTVTGDPRLARYDAPFKPWFLRRNEVIVPIAPH